MCGIAGILSREAEVSHQLLGQMAARLQHRGPDAGYRWSAPNIGFAIRRLSIVNLEGGHQPVASTDASITAILNGEIFNHADLRKQLEAAGHAVPPGSDAAVIPAAFLQWGEGFVTHLIGDFAIALWNARDRSLRLYRDRVGVKPLYYVRAGNGDMVFASEVKALFAHTGVPRTLSPVGIGQIATYWSTVDGTSVFSGVTQVPAGCYVILWAGSQDSSLHRYWDVPFGGSAGQRSPQQDGEWIERFWALLADATSLRLQADVEVATYTSGGIDSALLNVAATEVGHRNLRTFSLAFADAAYDEGPYQRMVAQHLGLRHTEVICRAEDIYDYFPKAVFHAEQSLFRTAPVPMLKLSEAVNAAGIKVVLTGEGADEAAWGYDLFQEARIRRFWSRQPGSVWRPRLLRRLYSYMPQFQDPRFFELSLDFFRGRLQDIDDPLYAYHTRMANSQATHDYFHPDIKAALTAQPPAQALKASLPEDFCRRSPDEKCQYLEMKTLLSGYLLASQGDRMQSAHGVEGRFPYLDHRLIELLAQMPPRLKLRRSQGKWVLRQSAAGRLPAAILDRPKFAYRAPGIEAFTDDRKGYVESALCTSAIEGVGIFDASRVQALRKKIQKKKTGFTTREQLAFTQVLSTQLLHKMYCRDDAFHSF